MTNTVGDFLDRYEPPIEEVPVCGRPGLIADHAKAESDILGHASDGLGGGPPQEMIDRLRVLEAEIEESVTVFRFHAIGYEEWSNLIRDHPPTKEQKAQGHGIDGDTFEPAAMAACAFDPPMDVEQATRMRTVLPPSEWESLVLAVMRLHREKTAAPKSLLLSVLPHLSGDSSPTPLIEGSLGELSSDDNGEQ